MHPQRETELFCWQCPISFSTGTLLGTSNEFLFSVLISCLIYSFCGIQVERLPAILLYNIYIATALTWPLLRQICIITQIWLQQVHCLVLTHYLTPAHSKCSHTPSNFELAMLYCIWGAHVQKLVMVEVRALWQNTLFSMLLTEITVFLSIA